MNGSRLSYWFERFIQWYFRSDRFDEIYGDLIEVYHDDLTEMRKSRARFRLLLGTLLFLHPRNSKLIERSNNMYLFNNYLLIARRNLIKHKVYTIFNIVGFCLGITTGLFMLTYVIDEFSYDKHFSDYERIFRVAQNVYMESGELHAAVTPGGIAPTMKDEFPEIESIAMFSHFNRFTINHEEEKFNDPNGRFVNSEFLEVFNIPIVRGDVNTALKKKQSLVLSESSAIKIFGHTDVIGKVISVDHREDFTITAVMADPPETGHFQLTQLYYLGDEEFTQYGWGDHSYYSYIKLRDPSGLAAINDKLDEYYSKYMAKPVEESFSGQGNVFLQNIGEIHLTSNLNFEINPNGNRATVIGMLVLALFVLLVAAINYTNMATAQAVKRISEVGIRKVMGSNRGMIIRQFLIESQLIVWIAGILALFLVPLLLPVFNSLSGKQFDISYFYNWELASGFILLLLATGLISGSYPAFYLSKFNASEVLSRSYTLGGRTMPLSKILNSIQFAVALVMVALTLSVYLQIDLARKTDLGFRSEDVYKVHLNNRVGTSRMAAFKSELSQVSGVQLVALAKHSPGDELMSDGLHFEKMDGSMTSLKVEFNAVDEHFIEVLDIPLLAGRNLTTDNQQLWGTEVLANMTMIRALGYEKPEAIIGKKVELPVLGEGEYARVVGVVGDVHLRSLHHQVNPHIMVNFVPIVTTLLVSTNQGNPDHYFSELDKVIYEMTSSTSHEITMADQDYWLQYVEDENRGRLFSIFSGIVVFLSLAGLAGLVAFHVRSNARALSIRKVFGAEYRHILRLIVKAYAPQFLAGLLIAIPLSAYAVHKFLENFAYRIDTPWVGFSIIATGIVLISILIISSFSRVTVNQNPIKYLKEE